MAQLPALYENETALKEPTFSPSDLTPQLCLPGKQTRDNMLKEKPWVGLRGVRMRRLTNPTAINSTNLCVYPSFKISLYFLKYMSFFILFLPATQYAPPR